MWVDIKSDICQTFGEFAVAEYAGYHCAIEVFLEMYQRMSDPPFFPSYIGLVCW